MFEMNETQLRQTLIDSGIDAPHADLIITGLKTGSDSLVKTGFENRIKSGVARELAARDIERMRQRTEKEQALDELREIERQAFLGMEGTTDDRDFRPSTDYTLKQILEQSKTSAREMTPAELEQAADAAFGLTFTGGVVYEHEPAED